LETRISLETGLPDHGVLVGSTYPVAPADAGSEMRHFTVRRGTLPRLRDGTVPAPRTDAPYDHACVRHHVEQLRAVLEEAVDADVQIVTPPHYYAAVSAAWAVANRVN
jgi:hypothetical protein